MGACADVIGRQSDATPGPRRAVSRRAGAGRVFAGAVAATGTLQKTSSTATDIDSCNLPPKRGVRKETRQNNFFSEKKKTEQIKKEKTLVSPVKPTQISRNQN